MPWLSLDENWPGAGHPAGRLPDVEASSIAVIRHTAGTAGQARGVMHTHQSLLGLLHAYEGAHKAITAEHLREFARPLVAAHKCPDQVFFVEALPMTPRARCSGARWSHLRAHDALKTGFFGSRPGVLKPPASQP